MGGQKGVDGRTKERFLILDFCRDTTFVMGCYEWDWDPDGRTDDGRLNFEIPLIASLPSLLFTRLAFAGAAPPLSLHFLILIRPLRESDLNPA